MICRLKGQLINFILYRDLEGGRNLVVSAKYRLFAQLNSLSDQILSAEQLEIQSVSCLWACSRSCVVAISSPKEPTYLITDLPAEENTAPLLELMQIYVNDNNGTLP